MSKTEMAAAKEKSLAKGLIAGLIGGLAGTVAMTFAERMFPPHTHGEPEPPELVVERMGGEDLSPTSKAMAIEGIHWAFGAAAGAAYGALAEFYPTATAKEGASFGLALETLTHEGALPALGFSPEPEDMTARERTSEITSHVVYGVATEMVRALVRKWI